MASGNSGLSRCQEPRSREGAQTDPLLTLQPPRSLDTRQGLNLALQQRPSTLPIAGSPGGT
jgi:hypothetical protein